MPRELQPEEITAFLDRHRDIERAKAALDHAGYTTLPLAYPDAGVAVLDRPGYVLVWRDASSRWHFIDLSGMPQMQKIADATNQPPFVSDPDYLGLLHDVLGTWGQGIEWGSVALAGLGLILLARKL